VDVLVEVLAAAENVDVGATLVEVDVVVVVLDTIGFTTVSGTKLQFSCWYTTVATI
jgi:hypothetical protein